MEGNYLFKVKYWSDIKEEEHIAYCIIPAYSMTDAVKELENYYGDNLLRVECDWKEHDLVFLPEAWYNAILSGEV